MFLALLMAALGGWGTGGCSGGPPMGMGIPMQPVMIQPGESADEFAAKSVAGVVKDIKPLQNGTLIELESGEVYVAWPSCKVTMDGKPGSFDPSKKYDGGLRVTLTLNRRNIAIVAAFSKTVIGNPSGGFPAPPPAGQFPDANEPPAANFGLDVNRIKEQTDRPSKYLCGKPVDDATAFDALKQGDPTLPNDATAFRLTAIGTKEQTAAIAKDVESSPLFADLKGQYTFQAYDPNDAMIANLGFAPGTPSVYLQDHAGKVLARWESYIPEQVAGEIRIRNPLYDPNKDPRPDKPSPLPSLPNIDFNDPRVLAALAIAAFLILTSSNKRKV